MNCEQIRDIILTDYLDNQLEESKKIEIDNHLAACKACKEFRDTAKKTVIEPFANTKQAQPPAFLWEAIKAAVESKSKPRRFNPLEDLLRLLHLPRTIFTLSSALALSLIALVLVKSPNFFIQLQNQQLAKAYLNEQIEYFSSDNGNAQEGDSVNLSTDIEKYLS